MTMTKKEQAAMQALEHELAMAKAFRRTGPVPRDLPPPTMLGKDGLTRGWDYNVCGISVGKMCSSSIYHGFGWERTSTQQARTLYSTEVLAWAALRYAVEQEAAENLARIDAEIARLTTSPAVDE